MGWGLMFLFVFLAGLVTLFVSSLAQSSSDRLREKKKREAGELAPIPQSLFKYALQRYSMCPSTSLLRSFLDVLFFAYIVFVLLFTVCALWEHKEHDLRAMESKQTTRACEPRHDLGLCGWGRLASSKYPSESARQTYRSTWAEEHARLVGCRRRITWWKRCLTAKKKCLFGIKRDDLMMRDNPFISAVCFLARCGLADDGEGGGKVRKRERD